MNESAQLQDGTFARPAVGLLTTPFGKFQEYNNGVRRHHLCTSQANDVRTPIYSSNDGGVTLAERLHLYGCSPIVDHVQEFSTSHRHLSRIGVNISGTVKNGQHIGLMGATGQLSGSPLQSGTVVNGIALGAEEWTDREFSRLTEGDNQI